jgi:RimJ/RimL family protein N-acetyltransferase
MQSIEQSFFDQGARTSRLEVRPDNRVAQRLYENLGYEVTQQVAHYYSNGDDALVMEKRLRPKRSFWSFLFPAKGRENVQAVIMSEDGGRRS